MMPMVSPTVSSPAASPRQSPEREPSMEKPWTEGEWRFFRHMMWFRFLKSIWHKYIYDPEHQDSRVPPPVGPRQDPRVTSTALFLQEPWCSNVINLAKDLDIRSQDFPLHLVGLSGWFLSRNMFCHACWRI